MLSSEYGYLLYLLPNLLVGLAYLVFLKRPWKIRLLAALPSALFLAVPLLIYGLVPAFADNAWGPGVLNGGLIILGILAFAVILFNLVTFRTWWHLLQVVNVLAGGFLLFVAHLILAGAG